MILLSTLISLPSLSSAVVVNDLYSSDVPVLSRTTAQREKAVRKALIMVMEKVSGAQSLVDSAAIKSSLTQAPQWVEAYSYHQLADPAALPGHAAPLLLHVKFQPKQIQNFLRAQGYTIWGRNRPLVLVWLALRAAGTTQLISSQSESVLGHAVQHIATQRGLPSMLPLFDLNEQSQLQPADVWNVNVSQLLNVSLPYQANAVLALRLMPLDNSQWEADGSLLLNGQQLDFMVQANDATATVESAMTRVTALLADHFAPNHTSEQPVKRLVVTINAVNNVKSYAQLLDYLRGFSQLRDISVLSVKSKQVRLALRVAGGQPRLQQLLSLDQRLLPVSATEQSAEMTYQWMR